MSLHPHSHYTDFNLPATDPAAPIDTEPVRLTDVPGIFARIVHQGDIFAAGDGGAFRGSRAERYTGENEQGVDAGINHFQGILRLGSGPRAFLAVSGGDSTEIVAHIFLFAMNSRAARGPWGSNLIAHGVPGDGDSMLRVIALERARWHPGGMALLGNVLAVSLEGDGTSIVRFLHVADPINPTAMPVAIPRPDLSKAGAVALGRLPDGRFICIVWREEATAPPSGRMDFYISTGTSLFDGFGPRTTVDFPDCRGFLGRDPRYQTIALIHPKPATASGDALFYLIGTENGASAAPRENGPNFIDLFKLRVSADGANVRIDHVDTRELHAPREYCNFDAAASVHLDTSGAAPRLHVYSAFHYRISRGFRFAEFYGRPDPAAAITDVSDGWIELYQHDRFRGRRLTIHGGCETTIEDYGRIFVQDGDFNETVSSVRWQLPADCIYRLYRDAGFRGSKPNVDFLDLVGDGSIREIADLKKRKFGDAVSSSRFEKLPSIV